MTLPYPIQAFADHLADGLKEVEMKDLSQLTQVADQINSEYHPDSERLNKAIEMVKVGGLRKLSNGNIQVPSSTTTTLYQVSLVRKECNCRDFSKRHVVDSNHLCKHILASFIWNMLPDAKVVPEEIRNIYAVLFPNAKVAA